LMPVAVVPVHLLEPEQMLLHRVLTAIRLNTTTGALAEDDVAHSGAWFRSPDDMARLYVQWPDALANTDWVAERCNVELPLGTPLFPQSELPLGETAFSYLWQQAFEGARALYRPLTPRVIQRLQYELDVIHELGFAPYFLIVWDIVYYARARDIPIVGRGSAANSLVAHVLGITRVDPFKYDLYFERFLNRSRTDCPDIDLDICWRRRDEVIDYVYRKYGADRVAMIATFNTFQARSALREVAKAFGWTDAEIGPIVRRIPHYHASDIRTLLERIPECRGLHPDLEPLKSILAISESLDGFPRHLSIHSGGLVIAPEPLTRFTPLQRAPKGIQITQYDMHAVEALGLIKMDLLGHRSLTVIHDAVEAVRANRGIALDIERLPDPDPLTADCIRTSRTIGCFQIESPAMRTLLKSVRADNTDMLIKTLSLIRPGPSGSGMKQHFIDRHLGKEPVTYPHPALEEALRDTYGVMLYQEDILKTAHLVADMDLAEADTFRRAMTKTRDPQHIAKAMKRFCEKAAANGVAPGQAETIGALMANFAEYS
ncbi:MAG: DNA polymerase III subunit alpha, partial [Candidatus Hydrogenedentes bacterium]|nr:DNA polymerase III subunit alpha [Candidatus Hydrogenedentota bacterium]